jgi:tyrosine-protein phosphatase non-receptor type 11
MSQTRRCFHPNLTGQGAERLLMEKGLEGSFLTRPSQNTPGDYSLSVKKGGRIIHIRIQNYGDSYDLYGGEKFATLAELVEYYIENPGQLKEISGEVIQLGQPLYYKEVTTERWYHATINGKEAERLLMASGTNGSYLVRMSTRCPGNYVLSARVGDEVTHLMIYHSHGSYTIGSSPKDSFSDLDSLILYHSNSPLLDTSNRWVYLIKPFSNTSFLPLKLKERVKELEKFSAHTYGKNGFYEEFEELQRKEFLSIFARSVGNQEKNRNKNRFKNILPFDHSLVVIKDPFTLGHDYINANYISGQIPGSESCYIATQGCLYNTINDFWCMVWQENSLIIVMITKEMERGKNKCSRYWPTANGPILFGPISVSLVDEMVSPHFVLRELMVCNNERRRYVYQFQFKAWPEHGVPQDPGMFLSFVECISTKARDLEDAGFVVGPMIVHCSAGIGRTGTFIAVDIIIKQMEFQGGEEEIDVQRSIQLLRTHRSGMVQNEEQYKLVYYTLLRYIELYNGPKRIEKSTKDDDVYEVMVASPVTPPKHNRSMIA